jgi:chromosome partitioning protein
MGLFSRGARSDQDRFPARNGSSVNGATSSADRSPEPPEPVFDEPLADSARPEESSPPGPEGPSGSSPSEGAPAGTSGEAAAQAAKPAATPAPSPDDTAAGGEDVGGVVPEASGGVPPDDKEEIRITASEALAPTRNASPERAGGEGSGRRAQVISFANQKGGVAKTTTTLNLAVAFAESGHDVLCIDLDPQGNLTMSQGIDPDKVEKSMFDVLVHHIPLDEAIHKREIDIAVASIDLAGAEIAMSTQIGRERSLEKAVNGVADRYDFICIDTPPSLGLLTVNALTASDKVIVPVQCEYLSMRGLLQLQNTVEMIRENLNPNLKIEGILPTMLDARTVHAKEAVEILEENFGELVFKSRIRKAIKFAEAPVRGSSVLKYDPKGNAADYYRELAKEVLTNGAS